MPRDAPAYLLDIIEACDAITSAIADLDLDAYRGSRLVRSSIEREFIIVGEAVGALSRNAPDVYSQITHARRMVDFRNRLTHVYAAVDDALVWGIAKRDVPVLRYECQLLLEDSGRRSGAD